MNAVSANQKVCMEWADVSPGGSVFEPNIDAAARAYIVPEIGHAGLDSIEPKPFPDSRQQQSLKFSSMG
jgi:hypothetical protein